MTIKQIEDWYKKEGLDDQWWVVVDDKKGSREFKLAEIFAISQKYPQSQIKICNLQKKSWIEIQAKTGPMIQPKEQAASSNAGKASENSAIKKPLEKRPTPSSKKIVWPQQRHSSTASKNYSHTIVAICLVLFASLGAGGIFYHLRSRDIPAKQTQGLIPSAPHIPQKSTEGGLSHTKVQNNEPPPNAHHAMSPTSIVPEAQSISVNSSFARRSLQEFGNKDGQPFFGDWGATATNRVSHKHFDQLEGKDQVDVFTSIKSNKIKKTNFYVAKESSILIRENQIGLLSCWVKSKGPPALKIQFQIKQMDSQKGKAEILLGREITLSSDQWVEICLPFKSRISTSVENNSFMVYTEEPFQEVAISEKRIQLFDNNTSLESLPLSHKIDYPGRERNAAWRLHAEERIRQHRTTEIELDFQNLPESAGQKISIAQQRHHFQHGSAMNYKWILGQTDEAKQYRNYAKELFNCATAENDQKWKILTSGKANKVEEKWSLMVEGNQWLKSNGLLVRGHVLVWPGFSKLPDQYGKDHAAGTLNWDTLRKDILSHIKTMGQKAAMDTYEWDVLNEPYSNTDLTDHFGREIMLEWFKAAKEAFPQHGLYLNDYGILRRGEANLKHREHFFQTVDYLKDNSAMTAFAMQGHFDELNMNAPEEIYKILEQLGSKGLPMRITEFDLDSYDQDLVADYLADVFTMAFSHPLIQGFQVWGFYEGLMNVPSSALVNKDWSLSKAGERYKEFLFKKHWTQGQATVDKNLKAKVRVYYGQHKITLVSGGKAIEKTIEVWPGNSKAVFKF